MLAQDARAIARTLAADPQWEVQCVYRIGDGPDDYRVLLQLKGRPQLRLLCGAGADADPAGLDEARASLLAWAAKTYRDTLPTDICITLQTDAALHEDFPPPGWKGEPLERPMTIEQFFEKINTPALHEPLPPSRQRRPKSTKQHNKRPKSVMSAVQVALF